METAEKRTQRIFTEKDAYLKLPSLLTECNITKLLIVSGKSEKFPEFQQLLQALPLPYDSFSQFSSNPTTEEVEEGIALFQKGNYNGILAVGGGSALDVAKGIKAFCQCKAPYDFVTVTTPSEIPFIAIPTTAGTGSESTDFAVIYENHVKLSLYHPELLPHMVILEPEFLLTLPLYQKKSTFLDALCQGIESYWSKSATRDSQALAKQGISLLLTHYQGYFQNSTEGNLEAMTGVLMGANFCGQAIQKTKTTAPHAMSYGLTSFCHIPHGYAVALCLPVVWQFMLAQKEEIPLQETLSALEDFFLLPSKKEEKGIDAFRSIMAELTLPDLSKPSEEVLQILCDSVNVERLSNHPISFSSEILKGFYVEIFEGVC